MAGGNGEELVQLFAVAGWALRLFFPTDEQFEFFVTLAAGVFVEGHRSLSIGERGASAP